MIEEKYIILATLVLIWWAYKAYFAESFANKQEKAQTLYDWFSSNRNPTYTKFKKDISEPNVVEYETVLGLSQTKKLTVGNVLAALEKNKS